MQPAENFIRSCAHKICTAGARRDCCGNLSLKISYLGHYKSGSLTPQSSPRSPLLRVLLSRLVLSRTSTDNVDTESSPTVKPPLDLRIETFVFGTLDPLCLLLALRADPHGFGLVEIRYIDQGGCKGGKRCLSGRMTSNCNWAVNYGKPQPTRAPSPAGDPDGTARPRISRHA